MIAPPKARRSSIRVPLDAFVADVLEVSLGLARWAIYRGRVAIDGEVLRDPPRTIAVHVGTRVHVDGKLAGYVRGLPSARRLEAVLLRRWRGVA